MEQRPNQELPANVEIRQRPPRELPRHVYRRGRKGYLYFFKRGLCVRLPDNVDGDEFSKLYAELYAKHGRPVVEKVDRRKTPKELPARKDLLRVFSYEPATGVLRWHSDGLPAGKPVSGGRYKHVRFMGQSWLAHRVIWKMVTGGEPDTIDHINGDGHDNRLANLRSVTPVENSRNRVLAPSRHGRHGVTPHRDRWKVQAGGRYIGLFNDYEAAVAARDAAEKALGFHENHGRPCPTPPVSP